MVKNRKNPRNRSRRQIAEKHWRGFVTKSIIVSGANTKEVVSLYDITTGVASMKASNEILEVKKCTMHVDIYHPVEGDIYDFVILMFDPGTSIAEGETAAYDLESALAAVEGGKHYSFDVKRTVIAKPQFAAVDPADNTVAMIFHDKTSIDLTSVLNKVGKYIGTPMGDHVAPQVYLACVVSCKPNNAGTHSILGRLIIDYSIKADRPQIGF